jgi:hypothetical protein
LIDDDDAMNTHIHSYQSAISPPALSKITSDFLCGATLIREGSHRKIAATLIDFGKITS